MLWKCAVPVLLLAGCATSYQPEGATGGFSETQVNENTWIVSFKGNGYTRTDKAAELALLRAAELGIIHGYTHFGLIDSADYSKTDTYTSAGTSRTTGTINSTGNGFYSYSGTTTGGSQTFSFRKPSLSNTVVYFKENPQNPGAYNAQMVCDNLGRKYEVTCGATR